MPFDIHPVTSDRWDDLQALFGPSGAYSGCWCMYLRVTSREFQQNGNAGNRAAMKAVVEQDRIPGLLAYEGARPVGWVSVAPRPEYSRAERSRITKPIDNEPAWAIVCFFVHPTARGTGAATALLNAAVDYAASRGATLLEAYPVDTAAGEIPAAEAWHGTAAMFEAAGFTEVIRRNKRQPVMRRCI